MRRTTTEDAEDTEELLKTLNEITGAIIAAAMRVHSALGPGLFENIYEVCLVHELHKAGLKVQHQVSLPVVYDNLKLEAAYRLDLLVEDLVIVELKTVEALLPVHKAQLLSYLMLTGKRLGLLINFKVVHLRDGIKRVVNGRLPDSPRHSSVSSASSVVVFDDDGEE
jgi:GxxExxY protein